MVMKKAQISLTGMIFTFIEFMVFVALFPLIQSQIETFKANSTSISLNLLVDLFPFFLLLTIIVGTLFGMSLGGGQQPQRLWGMINIEKIIKLDFCIVFI